ncbi:MAG: zinc metallopeptidase [Mycoplasmataceae bacterium]|nr:zinc metallopeptidase [Mycoplasmataceae bacterium]
MEWYLEPWFWFLMIIAVMFIAVAVQSKFKKTFKIYGATPNSSGKSGAQIAQELLTKNGIDYVKVVSGNKKLGDNFNPTNKTITLSPEVYGSASIAAEAIAAHEVGHAVQWHKSYVGIKVRDFFMPVAKAGSVVAGSTINIAFMIIFFGSLFFGSIPVFSVWMLAIGAVGLAAVALFQIVTLPVEFNASARASKILANNGYTGTENQDANGIKKMLNTAAMTYVVAVMQSLVQIMYLLALIMTMRRN